MQTTIEIDDDVLLAARDIAEREHISVGRVLSRLARQTLNREEIPALRNGVPLFPVRSGGQVVTLELVNQLRAS
jgi:hypothetical protein